jgi:UDP-2-acetamido-3-amino-2,3-dideoxy-glucuronate N-acetyltransferase
MLSPKKGEGVIIGKDVQFGRDVTIWNFVVIGDKAKIGDRTRIGSFCDIGKDVVVGRDCNIQAHVTISNECKLGDKVFVGPNSSFLNDRFPDSERLRPAIIENNAIIGGCVTILPAVTVGENSVIAAGSVVTKDVVPRTVVRGLPATPMMTRRAYEKKRRAYVGASRSKPSRSH